jgi:hypothetical protein
MPKMAHLSKNSNNGRQRVPTPEDPTIAYEEELRLKAALEKQRAEAEHTMPKIARLSKNGPREAKGREHSTALWTHTRTPAQRLSASIVAAHPPGCWGAEPSPSPHESLPKSGLQDS